MSEPRRRLLFASVHGYLDPSSGAALATRDLLELMAARGWECRALTTGLLDYQEDTPVESVLDSLGLPSDEVVVALAGGGRAAVYELRVEGVDVAILPVRSSRPDRSPAPDEAAAFLALAAQALDRFRPHAVLTYGGHPASLALASEARRRGIAVVFHLHNFAYDDPRPFADASAVLVPTEYARRLYAARLGLDCVHVPLPLNPRRVLADDPEPRFATFVNPQALKGAALVARLALEMGARRPDVPFLIVEGRAAADELGSMGLDLSGLSNLHRMANTHDPRAFYRVSRAVLIPSLVENASLVAREAMSNGVPVLASDRGGLPETLGDAGFLLPIPWGASNPDPRAAPTARQVAAWAATLERLWDDPAWEAVHRARARETAQRWEPDAVAVRYLDFFESLAKRP